MLQRTFVLVFLSAVLVCAIHAHGAEPCAISGAGYRNPASWTTFDPGANGVGVDPDGFYFGAMGSRYLYFAGTESDRNVGDAELMRYDTQGAFSDTASWETFNPAGDRTFTGAVYDDVHGCVFFVPQTAGAVPGRRVYRYCETRVFGDPLSWDEFEPPGIIGGFYGGVFDGTYVYFVPNWCSTGASCVNGKHGEVVRYDTRGDFFDSGSWEAFDAGPDHDRGYCGAIVAGDYVYLAPHDRGGSDYHGNVLRFDRRGGFTSAASWESYDAGHNRGYCEGVFDGTYVYFLPQARPETNNPGEILRFDPSRSFDDPQAWESQDSGCGEGYAGAVFDGQRFIYMAGFIDGAEPYGEHLRFDTWGDFHAPASWSCFDPGDHSVGVDPDGYRGVYMDNRYVYYVPFDNGTERHGEVLRYDTCAYVAAVPTVSDWGLVAMGLLILTACRFLLVRRYRAT